MARAPHILKLLLLTALVAAPHASAAVDSATSLRFTFVPSKAFQDKKARVEIAVRPTGVRCSLWIRYADGRRFPLGETIAVYGKAKWTWTVPRGVEAGPARVTASCRGAGSASRTIVIVGSQEVPTRLFVTRQGFTQRNDSYGNGSFVSFGLVLENQNPGHDVVDVALLVNFLNADGRVMGSKTMTLSGVAASSQFYFGDSMTLESQVPITRLEVVVTSAKVMPHTMHFPSLAAVGIEPAIWDPGWVGAVAGELINDNASKTLQNCKLSIVVLDAAGNILGGGSTFTFSPLPPGSRILFKSSYGFRSIPIDRAASILVSIEPTWAAAAP